MKYGDKVAVFYDGKLCRGAKGIVTKTKNGHHIKVKFTYDGKEIEAWFRKHANPYGDRYYSGWAKDIQSGEDFFWFKVLKWCNVPNDYKHLVLNNIN